MGKHTKLLVIMVLLASLVLSLAACGGNEPKTGGAPAPERVLRMDEENLGYPSVYTVSPRGRGYLMMSFIFDTLTWKDEDGIVPLLAEEWDVAEDRKTWTFRLAQNAEFTDGLPVTAEDVVFSFNYLMEHPHPWVFLNMINEVTALDQHTVEIVLSQVYAPFLTDVAGNVPIMPKHIWEGVTEPEKFNTPEAVIGSGPFKLASYQADTGTYVYEANKDYFLGAPVVDKLIFSPSQNPAQALEKGELDAAQRIKYGEAQQLKQEGRFAVIEGPGFWVARVYLNFDRPEFQQQGFRQALYYAINRPEIVEKATRNSTVAGNPGHIHPDSEWFCGDVKQYGFDPARANQLLDELGMRDANGDGVREYNGQPLTYEFLVPDDSVNQAELIKAYTAAAGIDLTVKAMDTQSLDALIKEGKFQLALNGHGSFGGDPVLLARFASPNVTVGSTPTVTAQGGAGWSNAEFDRVFEAQLREVEHDKRYQQVARLQQIIADELPTLTLYYRKITLAYNQDTFDGWFFTKDGVAIAVPTVQNKLVYLRGEWK